jgi:hypothetical protein
MAITRTTWVDDDGTGTTGTIINNAELQKIYNNIDAFGNPPQVITSTITGTVHDWNPGLTNRSAVISWQGASDLLVTGLVAHHEGQIVTIVNHGSGTITFANNNAGSAVANRLQNYATSAPTPIASLGNVTYVWILGLWRLLDHEQGAWINEPYNAANYAWTVTAGQVRSAKYRVSGKTLHWNLDIYGSSRATTGTCVRAAFGGFTFAAGIFAFTYNLVDSSGAAAGYAYHEPSQIVFYRTAAGGLIPAGTVSIYSGAQCEVT